jgi:hypothetical protein
MELSPRRVEGTRLNLRRRNRLFSDSYRDADNWFNEVLGGLLVRNDAARQWQDREEDGQ